VSTPFESAPEPRFCPFCGQPLGSFFGNRMTDGSRWCEGCQESFRVSIVNLSEGIDSPLDEGAT
jgi:transcription elongation factor Elf1